MKLWEKINTQTNKDVEDFTSGKDRNLDLHLAEYDIYGSIAHAWVLLKADLLNKEEQNSLHKELLEILKLVNTGKFKLDDGIEDVHSQLELMLTEKLGDAGRKIHTARSRNDQVLTCLKLFLRSEIRNVIFTASALFDELLDKSEQYKNVLMPGYTHLQVAMPSSFGLWLGAYAEELANNTLSISGLYQTINKNPLGSGAGYGSSFNIDRQLSTELLGFDSTHLNVINAQMARGENEKYAAIILSFYAHTLSRLAYDICLYCGQDYNFIRLSDPFITGSSIMPHKKNPDVLELIRAKCNQIQSLPYTINMVANNLPTGYHRDYQILKEIIFPAFTELKNCMSMFGQVLKEIQINDNILRNDKYKYIFSVEEVNRLIENGMPFRNAYKQVGNAIGAETYNYTGQVSHTHLGSIGNPGNEIIRESMKNALKSFNFDKIEISYKKLLQE